MSGTNPYHSAQHPHVPLSNYQRAFVQMHAEIEHYRALILLRDPTVDLSEGTMADARKKVVSEVFDAIVRELRTCKPKDHLPMNVCAGYEMAMQTAVDKLLARKREVLG